MSLIPGQIIHNRYKVIALRSPGGMSAVYEVIDTTLNLRCALKVMMPYPGTPGTALPQLREQFQQEARLLAELRHPNLPRVTDHFEEDGNVYLVMDYIYGERLDEVVNQNEEMSEDQVLDWARQLMEALAYCHKRGVIHRDVKPQNVIITLRGRVVLVDFGLAKLVDPTNPRTRTVMRGLGTPEYAPPEQYDTKEGRTDSRTDIYSLGATLYHALAGEPPPMLADRVVDPESLVPVAKRRDGVSLTTSYAVDKAMALQPSQRFQDISEMYEALFDSPQPEQIESVVPSEVGATPSVEPPKTTIMLPRIGPVRLPSSYRLGAVLVVVSLVSLVVVTSLVAGGIGGESTPTATVTPTAFVTVTPTRTPTATSLPTATFTASPTSRPPTRRPTRTPEESDPFYVPITPVTASPTPTQVYIPLSPTYTPTPSPIPTNTPQPPRPRRENTPTNTPRPPDTPTSTSPPPDTPTPTTRPPPTPPTPPTDTPTP